MSGSKFPISRPRSKPVSRHMRNYVQKFPSRAGIWHSRKRQDHVCSKQTSVAIFSKEALTKQNISNSSEITSSFVNGKKPRSNPLGDEGTDKNCSRCIIFQCIIARHVA